MTSANGRKSTGSEKLKELFRSGVVTQARLAAILNIKQQAVSQWIRGVSRPTLENMLEIERLYAIPTAHWAEIPPAAPKTGTEAAVEPAPPFQVDSTSEGGGPRAA